MSEKLVSHRERLELSQEELAERAGLAMATVWAIETGRVRQPRMATRRKLARVLGLTAQDLLAPEKTEAHADA